MQEVVASHDYASDTPNELSFKKGDVIKVLLEHASGWWKGSVNGQKGLFPVSFTSGQPTEKPVVPPRGAFYQSMRFEGSPSQARKIVVPKRDSNRVPVGAAPNAPPQHDQPATAAAPSQVKSAPLPSAAPIAPIPVKNVAPAPTTSVTAVKQKERSSSAAPPKQDNSSSLAAAIASKQQQDLTLEQAKLMLHRRSSLSSSPTLPQPDAGALLKPKRSSTAAPAIVASSATATITGAGGGASESTARKSSGQRKQSVAKTMRGFLFGRAQEAPAVMESPPSSVSKDARRKEIAQYKEMTTTKTQWEAAEKFKNATSRLYDHSNLENVRNVFDGFAGSESSAGVAGGATNEALQDDDADLSPDRIISEHEKATSRAALDLCSRSPKVFQQSESRSDRMRLLREMSIAERQTNRQLFAELTVAEKQKSPEKAALAPPAPAAMGRPSVRKRSGTNSDLHKSFDVPDGSLDELNQPHVKKPDDARRADFYGHCVTSEWTHSHTMVNRQWVADSMKVPVLKQASWALVDVKDGEFHVETGKNAPCESPDFALGKYFLEDMDCYRFWMRDFFLTARHAYFLCQPDEPVEKEKKKKFGKKDSSSNSLPNIPAAGGAKDTVLIVVRLGDEDRGEPSYIQTYHKHGTARVLCTYSSNKQLEWFLKSSPLIKFLIKTFNVQGVRPYINALLDKHMIAWERGCVQRAFKFGVVYATNGQSDEDAIYSNEKGSDEFRTFLTRLGNIVPLKGHAGYRAGLNVTQNLTGFLSVYNAVTFNEDGELLYDLTSNPNNDDRDPQTLKFTLEVMFHVSTFLPFSPDEPQQLQRKRHIGNDVCVVIFKERSNTGFDESGKPREENIAIPPRVFTSQFNHTFLVVTPWKFDAKQRTTHYKVAVCSKDGVKPCRPYLPKNGIISVKKFTHWILAKLINCERGAMYAKNFSSKESRTNVAMMTEALNITTNRGSVKLNN